ncbi:hypothetical protein J1N35_036159 [Gossypium stocksii]|uniref:Uncharacterized protein n=1 Tax=Gossypium stocksii TaxID=47602 RepID=A0A9D3UHW2_9ROSI|nr:hypothetical protein J1N35_036159 [Gossypium stocksii]
MAFPQRWIYGNYQEGYINNFIKALRDLVKVGYSRGRNQQFPFNLIIYVVDGSHRDRVVEAKDALHRILSECKDELRDIVLLVFANKQDLPDAMNTVEITDKLGLHSLHLRHW